MWWVLMWQYHRTTSHSCILCTFARIWHLQAFTRTSMAITRHSCLPTVSIPGPLQMAQNLDMLKSTYKVALCLHRTHPRSSYVPSLFSSFSFLRQGFMWPTLTSNSLCSQRWPRDSDPPASVSQRLGLLQTWTSTYLLKPRAMCVLGKHATKYPHPSYIL